MERYLIVDKLMELNETSSSSNEQNNEILLASRLKYCIWSQNNYNESANVVVDDSTANVSLEGSDSILSNNDVLNIGKLFVNIKENSV